MTPVKSVGILLYRRAVDDGGTERPLQVWIGHMGGPYWAKKDEAAWSVPKGLVDDTDLSDELATARREFAEEIGTPPPDVPYELLGSFKQSSGKTVVVYAAESEFAPGTIVSNTFELEWPPRSGIVREYPEIDDARWFDLDEARVKLVKGQRPILDALIEHLAH
jgi:predicted NUDIX family NTP pyrophosphohydrolase